MNTLRPPQCTAAAYCLALSLIFLAGCVSLHKKFPDIRTYAFDAEPQKHVAFKGDPVSIKQNAFSALPAFSDRYLTYRTGDTTYEQDFYNQLMTNPARMIEDQFSIWMKASPLVSFIVPSDVVSNFDYAVDGKVMDISGDYRNADEPKAVLKITFTVNDTDSDHAAILFQKVYAAEVPMKHVSPVLLTEGWRLGLGSIFAEFENDFKNEIEKISESQNFSG